MDAALVRPRRMCRAELPCRSPPPSEPLMRIASATTTRAAKTCEPLMVRKRPPRTVTPRSQVVADDVDDKVGAAGALHPRVERGGRAARDDGGDGDGRVA